MAKKSVVKFRLVDAPAPKALELLGQVILRAPLDLNLRANSTIAIDLGLTCDRPLLIISSSKLEVIGNPVVGANQPVKFNFISKVDMDIGRGENLIAAIPLGLTDVEVVTV